LQTDTHVSEKHDASIFKVEVHTVIDRMDKKARCKEDGQSDPRDGVMKLLHPKIQQSEDGKMFMNGE
jgi:hypothetical protein